MNTKVETKYTPIQPSRQIDQMLMQTRSHHVNLSSMADLKANIMLTLAALIVTFSIGYLDNPILRWPVIIMIFFCVITILAAAYAVMPKIKHPPQLTDTENHGNILFFGHFMHMSYETYEDTMQHIIRNPDHAYEVQIREIYELGTYLARQKYRFVQIAYQSFLLGVVISTLVFGIVLMTG